MQIQRLQNSAARVITLSRKSTHITPILRELHWLPVNYRIIYKLMLFVFKSLNGAAPAYIDDLLQLYHPSRNLRSSNKLNLIVPKSRNSWGDRSFSCAAPRIWNTLPFYIKSASTLVTFKKHLKTYLFNEAFNR